MSCCYMKFLKDWNYDYYLYKLSYERKCAYGYAFQWKVNHLLKLEVEKRDDDDFRVYIKGTDRYAHFYEYRNFNWRIQEKESR
jgi:hypothetical protein